MMDEYEVVVQESHPGVITGKPLPLGGSQGRKDATARGGIYTVREACKVTGTNPTTYAIQGFGNAGQFAALLHKEILGEGVLVAVSDTSVALYNPDGIEPKEVVDYKLKTGKLKGFPNAKPLSEDPVEGNKKLLELDVDILYPAALENVITKDNAERIKAKLVCELANGPTTPEADQILFKNRVHVIPDFLANAGGVTVSYFEQVQNTYNYYWELEEVYRELNRKMSNAYHEVYNKHKEKNVHMRLAAYLVAVERVVDAMRLRGWV
jgi:glutamate dehydrogenase (NAD(P)+)